MESQPESRELFYLVGMFRTLSQGDSISVALRKLLQGGGEKSGYIQVCNNRSRQSEHQRSGMKVRNLVFCVWEDASLWAPWIHFLHMHFSYLGPNPCSPCFLHFPSSSAITVGVAASAGLQFWEPSFTCGGQK